MLRQQVTNAAREVRQRIKGVLTDGDGEAGGGTWVRRRLARVAQQLPAVNRALNAATGYAEIEQRKARVEEQHARAAAASAGLVAARAAYDSAIDARRRAQKELNSLLQRKDAWVDSDVLRFTDLYRKDLALETDEATSKQAYIQASGLYESSHAEYLNQVRERYIEEQLFSDKIRSASTWWTVGLISAHLAIFLMVSLRDPYVKRRDRIELVAVIKEMIQQETILLLDTIKSTESSESNAIAFNSDELTVPADQRAISPVQSSIKSFLTLGSFTVDQSSFLAGVTIGAFVSIASAIALR
ncbi:sensitivity to high expression protein she9 [Physocladia obscura]|uniref:Sensitive to high expression protein 9, mitochondrial n=1 Tax=Physocladia obscura TaxID=109957 RepID=A0AAD5SSK8_9FUNG|nr:sensitivity to high expression protein she9 [Physocladia obscura]